MSFFVEDSCVIVTHLLYQAALVLAVLRWVFSWGISFRNRSETHLSPSSSNSNNHDSVRQAPSSQQIRESLSLTTFGDIKERVPEGHCAAADDHTCAVCLSQLRRQDEVRELRNCCHVFHKDCIDRWVSQDYNYNTCPLCRAPLLTDSQRMAWTRSEPSWVVERILYLFGDDLLM